GSSAETGARVRLRPLAKPCTNARVGASPSGKAAVFGTAIPRFESWRPSHPARQPSHRVPLLRGPKTFAHRHGRPPVAGGGREGLHCHGGIGPDRSRPTPSRPHFPSAGSPAST